MKRGLFLVAFLITYSFLAFSQSNNHCNISDPFCTGTNYNFPAGVNAGSGETGPNYGCLYSTPNPAWYYMQVQNSGNITIAMQSVPQHDIDFACWGPFTDATSACTAQLTATCTSCPNNTSTGAAYPYGNLVDCSYSTSWNETCHIPNAIAGQWYILMITNFSNVACNIQFSQTIVPGTTNGTTNCGIIAPPCSNNGPVCQGDTLKLFAQDHTGATFHWTGPAGSGFTSNLQNPVIPHATTANTGTYSLVITVGTQTSPAVTTAAVVYARPTVSVVSDSICVGQTASLTAVVNPTGTNTFLWSTAATTAIISPAPIVTTPYSVITTDSHGCKDTANAQVTVSPNPTSTFYAPPRCGSIHDTIVYTGISAPGATYSWTVTGNPQPASTFTGPGPIYVWWADPTTTQYDTIRLTVTNHPSGCTSTTQGIVIVFPSASVLAHCCINPPVDADMLHADNKDSICGINYQLNGSNNPSTIGLWTAIGGPTGYTAVFSNTALYNSNVTVNKPGTYTFQWKERSGSCDTLDIVNIKFIEIPRASAGLDQLSICGNTSQMWSHPSVGTGQWDGLYSTFSTNDSNTVVTCNNYQDTILYIWTETNIMCTDADTILIRYHRIPTPFAGFDSSYCGNTIHLYGNSNYNPDGEPFKGRWTGPAGTIFIPNDTVRILSAIVPPYDFAHDTAFYWHQTNEMCHDSDKVIIHLQPFAGSEMVSAGFNRYICGDTVTLHGITQGASVPGHWSTVSQHTYIFNPNLANTYIQIFPDSINFGDSSKYVVTMLWTATSGNCHASDTMKATFYQRPRPDAGPDNAYCGTAGTFQANPSIRASAGQWQIINYLGTGSGCMTPVYGNQNYSSSTIQVNCYGVFTFVWREYNKYSSLCSSTDTVRIEFIQVPTFSAGSDRWVCGDTVHLHAIPSGISSGHTWLTGPYTWYNTFPNDQVNAQENPNAIAQFISGGNSTRDFIFREWNVPTITIPNNPTLQCYKDDTVLVHFFIKYPAITPVDTLNGTLQCGNCFTGLNAEQPPAGAGFWWDQEGTTDFLPSDSSLHIECAEVATYGLHHYYWIVRNGQDGNGGWVCVDTSDAIPIRFYQRPVANAGGIIWANNPDTNSVVKCDTACGNKYSLHPVLSGPGIGQWVALGYPNCNFIHHDTILGTTSNPLDTAHTVIFNSDDPINHPYWTYTWIVANGPYQANCTASDTLRLTFAQIPNGKIASIKPKCYGQTATIFPGDDPFGKPDHFNWNFGPKHTIEQMVPYTVTSTLNDSIFSVSWDTVGQNMNHVVSLITSNPWGCFSVKTTDTIKEPTPFYPKDSIYATTCFQSNGKIILFPSGNGTYKWTDPEFANNPTADVIENLMPYHPYHLRFTYASWTGIDVCVYNYAIVVPDTGEVFADFTIIGDTSNLVAGANEVFFTNTTTGGRRYEWHFGDGTTSTAENTSHSYTSGGRVFWVYLKAISKEGCESQSDSVPLYVDAESELEAPNIFSPNGDGHNDYYQVKAKTLKTFDGTIVNRWGKTLFTWTEWDKKKNPGWDGKMSGTPAAPGVYYYILKAEGWDGIKYELKGSFNLMRDN